MLLQLLTTSFLLGISLAAPAEPVPRDAIPKITTCSSSNWPTGHVVKRDDAKKPPTVVAMQPCSSRSWPTLPQFQDAATKTCNKLICANAPNPPLLPTPIIDPKNPPIFPPLHHTHMFHDPNPDKKKAGLSMQAEFEITGFAPVTRESCLEGFTIGRGSENTKNSARREGFVCKGEGGKVLVQGWDMGVWWNKFKAGFGKAG